MPRKPVVRSNSNYYHVMARSNNKDFFYLPILNIWDLMTEKLGKLQRDHQIKIAAFVLMNNHFHLLVLTPEEDIDRIMYLFMKDITLEIQKRTGRINKIFGGRYKGCIIDHYRYLINVYKYIYRNPVDAGLTSNAEQYPYSSLFFKYQPSMRLPFRLEPILPPHAFVDYEDLDELKWINNAFDEDEKDSIECGLLKTTFEYKKDRATNKPIEPVVRHPRKKTQDELWEDMFGEEEPEVIFLPSKGHSVYS